MNIVQNDDFIPEIGFCKSNLLNNLTTSPTEMENCCIHFDICYQTCGADYHECLRSLELCIRLKCQNNNDEFCAMKMIENQIKRNFDVKKCDIYLAAQREACACEDQIS